MYDAELNFQVGNKIWAQISEMVGKNRGVMNLVHPCSTLFFFYKNKVYKNGKSKNLMKN